MPKQNVTISRYHDSHLGWEMCIRPDDGAWVLFVPRLREDGTAVNNGSREPSLWLNVGTCKDSNGDTQEAYALADSPEHRAYIAEYGHGLGLVQEATTP